MELTVSCNAPTACSDHGEGPADTQEAVPSPDKAARHQEEETMAGDLRFNPPVFRQRYSLVHKVLVQHGVESVVDFGCADCKIARMLTNVGTVHRVALVDVDRGSLEGCWRFTDPDTLECLVPLRTTPLTVSVFCGSAAQLDARLVGYQAASLVEVIEHLEPAMLQQVAHNVFGRLRPSVVIVTTPNAEFNVLFPKLVGFRHYDHKFEWTREEFQQWCGELCTQHGYTVSYTGVGDPPPGLSHLGFCSQAAIFTEASGKSGEQTDEQVYELVHQTEYPYDIRSSVERLQHEIQFSICSASRLECFRTEDETEAVVPVSHVHAAVQYRKNLKNEQWTEEEVMTYLRSHYTLTNGEANILVQLEDDWRRSESEDGDEPQVTPDHQEDSPPQKNTCMEEEEPWD